VAIVRPIRSRVECPKVDGVVKSRFHFGAIYPIILHVYLT